MIKILGTKRLMILLVLAGFNALLGSAVFLHYEPQKVQMERQLNSQKGQLNQVRNDIANAQLEKEQLEQQKVDFEKVKSIAFFNNQNRRRAEELLADLQRQSRVISAEAKIGRGVEEDNDDATKAEHVLLASEIDVKVSALDDLDVYRYIYLMKKRFPGHLTIQELDLKRNGELNSSVYRQISSGQSPRLVEATLQFKWRTMIPQDEAIGGGEQ